MSNWRRSLSLRAVLASVGILTALGIYRVTSGGDDDGGFHPPHENAELLRISRAGRGIIVNDLQLVEGITGEQQVHDSLVSGAFCVANLDWMRQAILSPTMIVATDPGLVRAAELYAEAIAAGDHTTAALIARTEQAYWIRDGDLDRLHNWANGLTDEEERAGVLQYLGERRQPASSKASDRFVVYAVQDVATEQNVFYLDTFRVRPDLLREPADRDLPGEVLVAGEEELRTMNMSDCDDVADGWDRYDPTLPTLPPIAERWQLELDETI